METCFFFFLLFLSNRLTSSATGPRVLTRPCWQMRQVSFEDKEAETCQLFDDRQRYCTEEMEGLKQRCSTKLRQASQMAAKAQQSLQLQVRQLQVSATPPPAPPRLRVAPAILFQFQRRCGEQKADGPNLLSSFKPCILNEENNVCAGGEREAPGGRLQAQPREGSRRAQTEVLRDGENASGSHT